jgi:hypothetical protein
MFIKLSANNLAQMKNSNLKYPVNLFRQKYIIKA